MSEDPSYGYEAVAEEFMAIRSHTGSALVHKWAASLPPGGSVVDVGSGAGEPLTSVLVDLGLIVSAIDASPTMIAAFRQRFPDLETACEAAESSRFFDQTFDAALVVGVVFLLPSDSQHELLRRVANALKPKGRLLFSAPRQACTWRDNLTGRLSSSLGMQAYRRILASYNVRFESAYIDEGGNHYYDAQKVVV